MNVFLQQNNQHRVLCLDPDLWQCLGRESNINAVRFKYVQPATHSDSEINALPNSIDEFITDALIVQDL